MFGAVVIATVVSSGLFRLAVADPSVMGLVWAGLASVAVVGVAFPIISLGFMRTRVLEAPVDLFVGQLSTLELELTGRASGLRMRCGRSPMFILDLTSPSTVRLPLQIASRSVRPCSHRGLDRRSLQHPDGERASRSTSASTDAGWAGGHTGSGGDRQDHR
ncbi:MAG: hypothetical protein V9F03_01885 [Microthrixaceae bacterium]